MTTPAEPQFVPVPAPLQWGVGMGQLPDGTKMCVVQLTQGLLTMTLQILPHDLKRLAADLQGAARQADTALILPTGSILNGNGH